MSTHTSDEQNQNRSDHEAIGRLYTDLLAAWNRRDAAAYAALFAPDAHVVGFDGSLMDGPEAIEAELTRIFAHHQTAPYIGKLRDVRLLTPDTGLLRAIAGMIPPGQTDLNPAVNTIQSLVAVRHAGTWRIALYQNTPAQFHGRPELVQQMTDELRALLP